ncbi:MAG: DNA mismatch repair endonuclease MutH [Candidatus Eutrophobiaceae bacterium]
MMNHRANGKPLDEAALMEQAGRLSGLSIQQLAQDLGVALPVDLRNNKGIIGMMLEDFLGADAASLSEPDFTAIKVELKSISVNGRGRALESTFVSLVHLLSDSGVPVWEESGVCRKLRRVLWVPIEDANAVPLAHRRIGAPLLWSPSNAVWQQLRADWEELMELVYLGRLNEIDAGMGEFLQIRPKAANARARAPCVDAMGQSGQTEPRGFYLRAAFTSHYVLGRC